MSEGIVSCKLMGGLGNQLFQIFATMAYGIKTKRKIVFPYSESLNTGIQRKTYWNNFLSSIKMMTTYNKKHEIENAMIYRYIPCSEKGFGYDTLPYYNDQKEIILTGYFQSYKYFESEKEVLLKLVRFNHHQDAAYEEFGTTYLNSNDYKISMHFRLGDYKNIQECHPLMSYEYYENSLSYLCEKRGGSNKITVLYFCQKEDNKVVQSIVDRLMTKFPHVDFCKVNDNIDDWKQLVLMSCCNDNIIANSTFSWWGAYFNNKPSRIVCYPSKWFGPRIDHNTDDLFPSDWVKISVV
jgi:hypothetical protein